MTCMLRHAFPILPWLTVLGLLGCQETDFVFQPSSQREGAHLRFTVQTPSKADILFVVDNSGSMSEEQASLQTALLRMLDALAPRDTSYRIGITSTDDDGWDSDCGGDAIPAAGPDGLTRGNQGNCSRPTGEVLLRRPHDGARGRLIGARDTTVFNVNATDNGGSPLYPNLSATAQTALANAFPTGLTQGPAGYAGNQGVRWVIDREAIREDACTACNCLPCDPNDVSVQACFADCVEPVARSLVVAYFTSNINGLGTSGKGWEAGLKSALWAVGVDPREADDAAALDPAFNLTAAGEANSFTTLNANGQQVTEGWIRDDALLAIMFVTDEEDCSMPDFLRNYIPNFEGGATPQQPTGSFCYQAALESQFMVPLRLAELLRQKKGSLSKVAVGLIGGVQNSVDKVGGSRRIAEGAFDCIGQTVAEDTQPSSECSCYANALTGQENDWCSLTKITSDGTPPPFAACEALAGDRYLEFASAFRRRTFDSICRQGPIAYGPALADFADIATLACFDLQGVEPAGDCIGCPADPDNIRVERIPREFVGTEGAVATVLPRLLPGATTVPSGGAWTYLAEENRICLEGIDRLIGDVYDIFVLYRDRVDYSR